jgi:hypothetical protein
MLAKELKTLAHEMSHKTGTRFHFHKEYFWVLMRGLCSVHQIWSLHSVRHP